MNNFMFFQKFQSIKQLDSKSSDKSKWETFKIIKFQEFIKIYTH